MCTALFYYTCIYSYSLLNFCGYWTLNKYYFKQSSQYIKYFQCYDNFYIAITFN